MCCLTTAFSNCNTLRSWCLIFYLQHTLSIDVYFPWFSSLWTMEIVLDTLDLLNFVPSFLIGPIFWVPYRWCHGWSCCASSGIWVDNSSVSFCESFSVTKLLQTPSSQSLLPSFSTDKENSTEEPLRLFPGSSWIVWLCNCSLQFVLSRLPILFHLGKTVCCWIEMTLTYVSLVYYLFLIFL